MPFSSSTEGRPDSKQDCECERRMCASRLCHTTCCMMTAMSVHTILSVCCLFDNLSCTSLEKYVLHKKSVASPYSVLRISRHSIAVLAKLSGCIGSFFAAPFLDVSFFSRALRFFVLFGDSMPPGCTSGWTRA